MKGYWHNWGDRESSRSWMADYTLNRALALRAPQSKRALRQIAPDITRDSLNSLLAALAGPGRTAIAFYCPTGVFEMIRFALALPLVLGLSFCAGDTTPVRVRADQPEWHTLSPDPDARQ